MVGHLTAAPVGVTGMRRSPRPLARTSPDLGWTSPGWGPRASSGAGGLAVGWAGSVGWGRVGDGGRGHLGSPGCAGAVGRGSWGPAGLRDVPLVGSRLRRAGVWLLPGLSPSLCCAAGCRGVPTRGGAGTRHVVTALLCLGTGQSPGGLSRVLLTVVSISPRSAWPWQVPALPRGWALGKDMSQWGDVGGRRGWSTPEPPAPLLSLPGSSIPPGWSLLLLHVSLCPCTLRQRQPAPQAGHVCSPQSWTPHHPNSSHGSLGSPTAGPSPGQCRGWHKAPLWVPKGWSHDRDHQPGALRGCGG